MFCKLNQVNLCLFFFLFYNFIIQQNYMVILGFRISKATTRGIKCMFSNFFTLKNIYFNMFIIKNIIHHINNHIT